MHEWDFDTGPRGLKLRICEWQGAESSRPVLVILHGFLEQGAAWHAVASRLSGRVLAPDARGHGLSEHVGRGGFYHFYDYLSDLDALVQHIGGPIDLLGHSMGGTVATMYAGTRPEQVRRLVLVEGLGPPDTTSASVARTRQFTQGMREQPQHKPLADVAAGVARVQRWNATLPTDVATRLVARTTEPHPDGGVRWTWDPLHRLRSPKPFDEAQFSQFIGEISAPTLLVDGGATQFVFDGQVQRAALVQHRTELVIDGAGHLVHHDAPIPLATAIEEHLNHD